MFGGNVEENTLHREHVSAWYCSCYQVSPAPPLGVIVRWINRVLYVEQVFGGRIQKNTLFPVARQPDGLQSRLVILHYLENYAKFQVNIHQRKLPSHFITAFIYVNIYVCIYIFFFFVRRGYQQQDAHEFMRYLLDHLHRELQYGRNGASHAASPQDGVRLSAADGKCCMYVNKFII